MADIGPAGEAPAQIFARPTVDEIWLGPTHASALSLLLGGAPAASLDGPPATGRSLILERSAVDIASAGGLVMTLDGRVTSARHALSAMLLGAGLSASHLGPIDQRNLLHLVVSERLRAGRRVVLLVDDADRLLPEVADEIDRLRRIHETGCASLQLRYVCNPAMLDRATAEKLAVDEGHRYVLGPLDDAAVRAYVQWRYDQACRPNPFTRPALLLIRRHAAGRFRGIDSLCRLAALLMQRSGLERIDVQIVNTAVRLLGRQRVAAKHATAARASNTRLPSIVSGKLIVTEHGAPVTAVPLARRMLIGRGHTNEICISGNDVSRFHAMIEIVDGVIEIVDLNSANGIWVNGKRARHSVLKDHDIVAIGAFKLKLETSVCSGVQKAGRTGPLPDTVVLVSDGRGVQSRLKSV